MEIVIIFLIFIYELRVGIWFHTCRTRCSLRRVAGFGMLESGCVSIKNEVNIMMKNVVDVVLGGLTYWMFGFALSFGNGPCTTPFMGCGNFFVDPTVSDPLMGPINAAFLFQLSFATTATTIVSGAMAERLVSVTAS
jgi:ammonia channel protein AmtB